MDQLQERVERYKRFRQIGMEMNRLLVRCLTKGAIQQGARQLGMWENGTVVFETEGESDVLKDHCLHVLRMNGQNTIERYLNELSPPEGSDEEVYLNARIRSHYSLLGIERRVAGVGVVVHDLLHEEEGFLFDIAFSHDAQEGSVLATRFFQPEGVGMTTGVALPVDEEAAEPVLKQISTFIKKYRVPMDDLSREHEDILATMITRTLLALGVSARIRYVDKSPAREPEVRIGRNQPCPCGSGKLFKGCCGAS
jgi:hypothetical protein